MTGKPTQRLVNLCQGIDYTDGDNKLQEETDEVMKGVDAQPYGLMYKRLKRTRIPPVMEPVGPSVDATRIADGVGGSPTIYNRSGEDHQRIKRRALVKRSTHPIQDVLPVPVQPLSALTHTC